MGQDWDYGSQPTVWLSLVTSLHLHVAATANPMQCVIFAYNTFNHTTRPNINASNVSPEPAPAAQGSRTMSTLCLHHDTMHRPLSDRLETPLRWASADPFAFVMLMSTSRCTARHSGACRYAPIDFAYPRGSRFQPKQGSDSSRRARDTAATMLHFMYF